MVKGNGRPMDLVAGVNRVVVVMEHSANRGKVVVRKRLRRDGVAGFFANLPACLVGMEASNGAHYWARVLTELGHQVRLISPQFVTPYVKSNKNDQNDAEAICEAVGRPSMRFVPPKSTDQLREASGSARCGNGAIPMSWPWLLPTRMHGSCGLCSQATRLMSRRCPERACAGEGKALSRRRS